MIAGKVMMDRDAPEALMDTAERGYDESKALIERWRGRGRLDYAITPRFAVTSTEAQLDAAGALAREFPDATSRPTPTRTRRRSRGSPRSFLEARSYIDVYARAGLLGPRSVIGHCIHLQESEVAALAESRSVAAFCPTSNLFLGSGLFDQARLSQAGVRIALATDVGGGHQLFDAAHGRRGLQGAAAQRPVMAGARGLLSNDARATRGRSASTTGSARSKPGKEADLVALDPRATPALAHRLETAGGDLEVELFALHHARRRSRGARDLCRGRAAEGRGGG